MADISDHPAVDTDAGSAQPHILLECRPPVLFAALYDELPFPHLGPVQEIAFDLGVTAVGCTFQVVGLVVRGHSGHQLIFEQRWPERFIRQKTRLEDLSVPDRTGIAIRAMHFQLHGYERLTSVEITVVARGENAQQARQALLRVPVEYPRLHTDLHFPLSGVWWAIQAADWSDIHKSEVFSQAYAMDFAKLDTNNRLFSGDGSRLEDHASWNEPVYAAAVGKVAYVCYDMPDIAPGTAPNPAMFRDDPRRLLGNAIAISHGNSEFSYYAHLRQASTTVNYGEMVRRGALIGHVGSSGQSPGPHLHFHAMNGPNLFIDQGLPLRISHFRAGGQFFKTPISVPTRMLIEGPHRDQHLGSGE